MAKIITGCIQTCTESLKQNEYEILATSSFKLPKKSTATQDLYDYLDSNTGSDVLHVDTDEDMLYTCNFKVFEKLTGDFALQAIPSKVEVDIEKDSHAERSFGDVTEHSFLMKASSIDSTNQVRFPLEANPRWPEHVTALFNGIRNSAIVADEEYLFQFKNNGMDMFAKSVSPTGDDLVTIEFGLTGSKDGLANGAFTFYSLQSLDSISDEVSIKVRAIVLGDGLSEPEKEKLKETIANTKNLNRKLSASDSANFHNYYHWMKTCLGDESSKAIKWMTGDQEFNIERKTMEVKNFVRHLAAADMTSTHYHGYHNPGKSQNDLKKLKTINTSAGSFNTKFTKQMNGGEE